MNWFQKLWSNGNFHAVVAAAAGVASVALPAFAAPLQIVAGVFTAPALALPGGSIIPGGSSPAPTPIATPVAPPAPVIVLPPAAAGGSYHTVDYANLAAALVAQFAPKPTDQARS